jgi:opacity protein-like surface antigen
MKKISLLVLSCFTSFALWAQETSTAKTSNDLGLGIKAGANFARLRTSDYTAGFEPDVDNKTSWYGGILVNIPLGKLAVQPELLYNSVGASLDTSSGSVSNKYDQKLDYISLPIMLQWRFGGGLFIETGPQASLLISAEGHDVDNKDDFEKFDFAWGLGLGYETKLGLGINARYNYGLTNTLKNDNSNSSSPGLKNDVFSVGLFFLFGGR